MKEQTPEEYRKENRESWQASSVFIDERYRAFFEVAKHEKENKHIPMRIETPYGDWILQHHIDPL